jgi:hypothetical protein
VQDAAAFLSPTGSAHNSPAPEQKKAAATKKETAFDPVAFASKLQYAEQVEQLGFTEAAAKDFSIGFYRGQVHPNPPLGQLDQRLCRLRRWADEASAEVAPRYFQRGHIPKKSAKKSPA